MEKEKKLTLNATEAQKKLLSETEKNKTMVDNRLK
jgi:hypothetical protein